MSNRNPRERFDYKSWFERNVAKRTVLNCCGTRPVPAR